MHINTLCSNTLWVSSIGPREHLEEHAIPVVRDIAGVGSNMVSVSDLPIRM
jgi:hypothetical protein